MKSERLKKLEIELNDLDQWLKLSLVPKKDIEKHKKEIEIIRKKIEEEKARLLAIKENGDIEEYSVPKRNPQNRQVYPDHTMPGIEMEDSSNTTDTGLETEEGYTTQATTLSGEESKSEENTHVEEEEEDPFSDRNRWRRGILEDPDSDAW
ncbi:MAG: hypothetical protein AAF443_00770 [Chlamydiota bacterium]